MHNEEMIAVVRIVGTDRPGILAEITHTVYANKLYMKHVRADVDIGQATVVLQLVGTSDNLSAAEVEMREKLKESDLTVVPFKTVRVLQSADGPVDLKMYPYLIPYEIHVPEARDARFLSEMTNRLTDEGINIVSYEKSVYEPENSIGHALASRHFLKIRVPLNVVGRRRELDAEIRRCADANGCIRFMPGA